MKWQLFEGKRNLRIEVVPDAQWPNMWRIKQPDGTLSDMVNLTRAKDAAMREGVRLSKRRRVQYLTWRQMPIEPATVH